ncbi:ABC transporter ATP-binding protein [Ruania rhizosphaerae]|uniref:ABC transporter ATP-binding protein n=1 Tax=Ruania rhizosphaerae TaxID=1840413 RepID=UPI001F3F428F|nr:ABC transporter ATP-binding protein [Ruania rhizosphaerae]
MTDGGEVVHAVAETNLTIPKGQFICVVGPSGCGKTTLLKILAGFVQPTGGQATLDEVPINAPAHERGVVFQQPNLYPWLSVRKNVELGLKFQRVRAEARRSRAIAQLGLVGLEQFAEQRPYELSGGMQQRAQIARVLASDPDIVLMDEPFGALDAITREQLQNDLLRIAREGGKTIFFITHSVDEAIFLGDRVLVMSPRPGRVVLDETIDISQQHGKLLEGAELRATVEFRAYRERIGGAILNQMIA